MARLLAAIQRVRALEPIPGADRIQAARVLGWTVVVKKGEFAVGDPCVFFEVDAVLPERDWAEFMRPRKFRVKTCRLRGQLSQGLALPVDILDAPGPYPEGHDVTDVLGVVKWEPAAPLKSPGVIGTSRFPPQVPKTDETRVQSAPEVLDEMRGLPYVATLKVDGMSGTFAVLGGELVVCSRNYALVPGPDRSASPFFALADRHGLAERIPEGFAVQGEVAGPGIQRNRLGLGAPALFAFDVYSVAEERHLDFDEFTAFCGERGIPTVPVDEVGESFDFTQEELLEKARGLYPGTANRREGLVIRPRRERRSEVLGGRLSFKVINNEFLLEDEE